MSESGVARELLDQVLTTAKADAAKRVVSVEVAMGPLSGINLERPSEEFMIASAGTLASAADLHIRKDADAGERVLLESVETEK